MTQSRMKGSLQIVKFSSLVLECTAFIESVSNQTVLMICSCTPNQILLKENHFLTDAADFWH